MMQLYTVFDAKAEFFLPIFMARTDAEAQRMFIGSLGDSFAHRADYNLFCLGEFDQDTGHLEALSAPLIVLTGATISDDLDPRPRPFDNIANAKMKDGTAIVTSKGKKQ